MITLLALLAVSSAGGLRVAVVGGSGRLGQRVVERLVRDGHEVKRLRRRLETRKAAALAAVGQGVAGSDGIQDVVGDVTNVESLKRLLAGCAAVIAVHGATRRTRPSDVLPWSRPDDEPEHAKRVNYDGIANLIAAMEATGCERIVRLTGRGERPWSLFSILINGLGSMAKAWNYEGEALLRNSSVAYSIIRPGVMTDEAPNDYVLGDDGADLKVAPISYAAVADLCVDVLTRDNCRRATLCAMTSSTSSDTAWGPLLDTVQPDRRAFPPSLYNAHLTAVRVGFLALLALPLAILRFLFF